MDKCNVFPDRNGMRMFFARLLLAGRFCGIRNREGMTEIQLKSTAGSVFLPPFLVLDIPCRQLPQ
jgi:hypothetical protein